jgi:putative serine protease PepD
MKDDEPRRGSGSERLWTSPREESEHTQWLAPKTVVMDKAPPPREPERPTAEQRLWPLVGLGTLIAVVLVGVGILVASLLRGDDSSAALAPLPAAPGAVAPDVRSRTVRRVYASVKGGVVRVGARRGRTTVGGTGFLVRPDGTIVTAAHVVSGADLVEVQFGDSTSSIDAEVLGTDASSDLAVLRVDTAKAKGHKPLPLADSDDVRVGDRALAIGYPLGLDETVTEGIVSGVGRAINAPNGFSTDKGIQTDASINEGNSGGPLLDGAGRVIGVNTQIATPSGQRGNVGIGFAVPSNTVRQVEPRLRSGATIKRPYLGIAMGASNVVPGALVTHVIPGDPADQSGVIVGDIVNSVDGKPVRVPTDISSAIENRRPGDVVAIGVQRAGAQQTLHVRLGTQPANAPSALTRP